MVVGSNSVWAEPLSAKSATKYGSTQEILNIMLPVLPAKHQSRSQTLQK